jgi:hypothetical protein
LLLHDEDVYQYGPQDAKGLSEYSNLRLIRSFEKGLDPKSSEAGFILTHVLKGINDLQDTCNERSSLLDHVDVSQDEACLGALAAIPSLNLPPFMSYAASYALFNYTVADPAKGLSEQSP